MTDDKRRNSKETAADLRLYIPRPEDGWFYVEMMSDPATMSYNAPWYPPYGCIPDADKEWLWLLENYNKPGSGRFYAFLERISDGTFVGDVNYHYDPAHDWYDMGIVIHAPQRGKGYGRQGLRLLLEQAFRTDGIPLLHNSFETDRDAAYHIHTEAGFRLKGTEEGMLQLELTREEYLNSAEA